MHEFEIRRWTFTLSDQPEAWAKGFDDRSWRAVTVPHDWSIELEFSPAWSSGTGYLPGGVGWYRAHVALAELGELGGRHVRLVFHGVYKNADVWANGYHLGGRPSGYAEFSFDLSEVLSYPTDGDLVLSVRVEHTDISDSRWYNGSGITRRVTLEVHEAVRLAEHGTSFSTLIADASEASVEIAQRLVNETGEDLTVGIEHELMSLSSRRRHTVAVETPMRAGASAEAVAAAQVLQPDLWSDTDPHLYRLTTRLTWRQAGQEHHATYEAVVGIRTFRFDPDHGFFINGERRVLKGVCLHEDAGCLGTAVPADVWLRRLLKLRQMGCNAIRMSHNPHGPELYRLCDALGFYVIDEAFDEWENAKNKWWQGHNVWPPRHQGYARDFHAWHRRDLEAMVDAHRNHPSIIAWSVGNEIDYPNDPYVSALFAEMTGNNDARKTARQRTYDPSRPDARRLVPIARRLAEIVRGRDTTRPVTIGAAYPELSTRTGLTGVFDLVGYNYKEHLYEEDHQRFPATPLVGSENGHGYDNWLAVVNHDYVAGQFLWTGIDYLGEAHGWPIHGSGAGLLTVAGFEKPIFHLRRSWWTDEPMAYIATRPHAEAADKTFWSHPIARRWNDAGAEPMEVLCFVSGDAPRLSCGDQEIPLTFDSEHGYWTAVTGPRPAPLVLEARQGGAVVATDKLEGRGPAARLDAAIWHPPPQAAGRCADAGLELGGIVQIECALRDAHGEAAAEETTITADVDRGELLGLESGDLGDNTPYAAPSRRTLDGRLVVFVRPHGKTTTVRLRAPDLADVEIRCG